MVGAMTQVVFQSRVKEPGISDLLKSWFLMFQLSFKRIIAPCLNYQVRILRTKYCFFNVTEGAGAGRNME